LKSVGSSVSEGETVFRIHARTVAEARAAESAISAALRFTEEPVSIPPLILGGAR
jgi:hypothetical protein